MLTAALFAVDDGLATTRRYVGFGLIAALAAWYAVRGAPGVRQAGAAYLAVAAPLTLGLFAVAPIGALMLFALYPHVWVMLPVRLAIPTTAGVVAGVVAVTVARDGLDDSTLAGIGLLAAVSLALALVLGLWIARIIRQSLHRAELIAELAAARAELAELSREAGALAERERLAYEIHDTLAQAQALTPPDLTRTSLPEALRRLVERSNASPSPSPCAALSVTGSPRGLPPEHEVALLRAAQEALTNARRHAGASRVEVSLTYAAAGVSLEVRDDGRGFDPRLPREGRGLDGMRARANRIGGTVRLQANPGIGVVVLFQVPT